MLRLRGLRLLALLREGGRREAEGGGEGQGWEGAVRHRAVLARGQKA